MVTPIQGTIGLPDLLLVRAPRCLFVELKSELGRLTPEQVVWLEALSHCRGIEVYVWRPHHLEEARQILAKVSDRDVTNLGRGDRS